MVFGVEALATDDEMERETGSLPDSFPVRCTGKVSLARDDPTDAVRDRTRHAWGRPRSSGGAPCSRYSSRSNNLKALSQSWLIGFFRSGLTILNERASATLSPPAISGSFALVSSLYSISSTGSLVS
jgi:hypothetical protein